MRFTHFRNSPRKTGLTAGVYEPRPSIAAICNLILVILELVFLLLCCAAGSAFVDQLKIYSKHAFYVPVYGFSCRYDSLALGFLLISSRIRQHPLLY